MARELKRPTNPYDPAWVEYRRQNPGLRLSLSAADGKDGGTVDLSFLPESYKGDDGGYDTEGFMAAYNDLVSFKAQTEEAQAALPQKPEDYTFGVGEDFAWPEGFKPEAFQQPVLNDKGEPTFDANGKPVTRDLTVEDLIDAKDPDIPVLQAALHEVGAQPGLMQKIAGLFVGREIRQMQKAGEDASDQIKALGPEGQSRIDTVKRSLEGRLPAEQAKALLDGISSADALRAVEGILKASKVPPTAAAGKKIDNATASIDDRIMAGLSQRKTG